jgi:hypothetical protein
MISLYLFEKENCVTYWGKYKNFLPTEYYYSLLEHQIKYASDKKNVSRYKTFAAADTFGES